MMCFYSFTSSTVFLLVPDFFYWFHTFLSPNSHQLPTLNHSYQLYVLVTNINVQLPTLMSLNNMNPIPKPSYSTVTLFAKFRGLSTSLPRANDA